MKNFLYIIIIYAIFCINYIKTEAETDGGGDVNAEEDPNKPVTAKPKERIKYTTNDDNIQILDYRSIDRNLYNSNRMSLCQFYAHWCPSCEKFAPSFKQLAKKVKRWKHMIRISVIDCGLDHNSGICDEHGVTYVPTFKLYYAYSKEPGFETGDDNFSVDDFIHDLIEFVGEHPTKPKSWPVLKPLGANVEKLFELNRRARYALLIFEDDNSYLARKFILDFSKFALKFSIRRVTLSKNPQLFLDHQINESEMPVFHLFQKTDSGEIKNFNFDKVVRNIKSETVINQVEDYEEEAEKKELRFIYGTMITKFIRYTPFDSHIDIEL